ncbi:hypothetical protein [uncultured Dysosmobacter sp.]|uniref:hypothetical protein n=1 Tax=uncultured Dysosmobacter sp. TaxID=2591384 RepID=UPI00261F9955|nr:hypothetical protein [uncultured Dysosmobacter sp.]
MGTTEYAAPEAAVRQRRVGTFTLGVTLVAGGVLMAVSLLWPRLDLSWALKLSPVILILLGAETLLAARNGSRIKYDWAGMLLCFLLTGAALCMYVGTWCVTNWLDLQRYDDPSESFWIEGGVYEGSRSGDENGLLLDYTNFNGRVCHILELEAGDTVQWEAVNQQGSVDLDIIGAAEREVLYTGRNMPDGTYSAAAPRDGQYEVWVTGHHAAGSVHVQKAE